jgi:hypothetical protein
MSKIIRINKNMLVEYKGDFYTPEELVEELKLISDVEVVLYEENEEMELVEE